MTEVTINISEVLSHISGPEPENVAYLLSALRFNGGIALKKLATQIDAAYTPPRIPEPEWGARVVAATRSKSEREEWLNVGDLWQTRGGYVAQWDNLIDPELVS